MATQKSDPAKEGVVADAEVEEEFFTDSEEEEGELYVGRRDVASDDEGEVEEGEIQDGHAAADAQSDRLAQIKLNDKPDAAYRAEDLQHAQGDSGYESEVEEDATEVPAEEVVRERRPQRKEREPFDVPTSGAFWMHDDRMADDEFAASGGGAQKVKKKLFDPDATEDTWKHDRFQLLDLPPEEDDYQGFLASGRRGRGRRGGRGGRGRQGVEPPPGYENSLERTDPAAGSSGQYDGEQGHYAEQSEGRSRGRGARTRGRGRQAMPYNGQQAPDSYTQEGRGSRGGRGGRGRRGAAHPNGASADYSSSGRGRGRSQNSGGSSTQHGRESLPIDEWPSLAAQQTVQRATPLNVGAKDYSPAQGSSRQESSQTLQAGAAPFAPPASALPEPGFIPGPLQASEGSALQPPVRRPVSIQAPADGGEAVAQKTGGRGRGSRRYTAAGGAAMG